MKRRVLLVDLGADFGGVESYLVSLARLLASEIDLYVLCVLPELAARLSSSGVKVILLPAFRGLWKPLRFVTAMMALPPLLLRYRLETVQLNGLLESILILPARLLGRSAVYTRHGPFEIELYSWSHHPMKFLARRIARWSVRFTTHVVCVSQAVAESVAPVLPRSRYSVISNWVAGQKPLPNRRAEFSSPARVICVSRLEHYKGIQLLIEAARSIPEMEVTVIGDGSDRASLEAMARDLKNVRFAGFQRNIEEFYRDADIFVMPSMGPEGLPITSLEAMAQGLPCIFSDLPVHREITDDGKGAYLFCSGEPDSLQKALRDLLASPNLRKQYATEAHRIVATRYSEQNVRQAYLRVLSGGQLHEYGVGLRGENASVNADLHTAASE